MSKVDERVEKFIEKWEYIPSIGITLKGLIEKHGKRETVGELIDAEMKTDLQGIVDEVKKEETIWCRFCGEGGFDLYGLQLHLQNDLCPVYGHLTKEQADGEDGMDISK